MPATTPTISNTTTPATTIAIFGMPDEFAEGAPEVPTAEEAAEPALGEAAGTDCPTTSLRGVVDGRMVAGVAGCGLVDVALSAAVPAGAPHFVQNLLPASGAPHFVQKRDAGAASAAASWRVPHFVQNALPSINCAPHCLQFTLITWLRRYFCPQASISGSRKVIFVSLKLTVGDCAWTASNCAPAPACP
jgi:hypothetical protein